MYIYIYIYILIFLSCELFCKLEVKKIRNFFRLLGHKNEGEGINTTLEVARSFSGVIYHSQALVNFRKLRNFSADGESLCLLSFGAESFVFQVAIQKFKDQDI